MSRQGLPPWLGLTHHGGINGVVSAASPLNDACWHFQPRPTMARNKDTHVLITRIQEMATRRLVILESYDSAIIF